MKYYDIKPNTIINGDALSVLKEMPDNFIHCGATSPPYYGLRNYGTNPIIWGGDPNCEHDWGEVHPPGHRDSDTKPGTMQHECNKNREKLTSNICSKCGAWKGELGLEPTPEMYVQHLVEIFREFRRVLREDGIFWLNISDSYWGGKGKSGGESANHIRDRDCISKEHQNIAGKGLMRPTDGKHPTIKPKDMIGIPWMLAFALRADGWYLRSDLPWIKRNSMPSSVTDRPCSSIEHIFLLSKSKSYYYDHVATMQLSSESYNKDKRPRGKLRQTVNANSKYPDEGQFKKQDGTGNPTTTGFNGRYEDPGTGLRFMRDSDFFFRTWQGLLHNENGEPMAMVMNPRGYKGAHFACWPVQLVEPMIVASTSEKGVCPECGAPWKRVIVSKHTGDNIDKRPDGYVRPEGKDGLCRPPSDAGDTAQTTIDWQPICKCGIIETVPALVLDPFSGSSATGVACEWHNRNYIGIELKSEYCDLGAKRLEEGK